MTDTKSTPEPIFTLRNQEYGYVIDKKDSFYFGQLSDDTPESSAQRIIVCLNLCAGLSELEIRHMIEKYKEVQYNCDN